MNRFTLTAAIAWLVAILLLGFMIKMADDKSLSRQFESGDTPVTPTAEPSASAAPAPPEPSCEDTERTLGDLIESARYCTSDSDCTLFDFGYPIECMTSVAHSEITVLRLAYRRYEQSCDYRVYYDCPTEPMERLAVCRENRCTVSLDTIDSLEEETLEYLGIEGSGQSR